MKEKNSGMTFVVFLVMLIGIWQLIYWGGVDLLQVWKFYAVPSPLGVWNSFCSLIKNGTLVEALFNSLIRGVIGYFFSSLLGMLIGLVMNRIGILRSNLRPVVMGIQTLPSICWVPFSILWFGLTEQAIFFVVIMGSAFSMSIAFDNAIHNVPQTYIKAAKTMGANNLQMFFKVIVPACIPELLAGLKQGWSFAWRALMSGEVMTTCIGLGQTLVTGRNLADINQVMLVMLVIIGVGIFIDRVVFGRVESYLKLSRGIK